MHTGMFQFRGNRKGSEMPRIPGRPLHVVWASINVRAEFEDEEGQSHESHPRFFIHSPNKVFPSFNSTDRSRRKPRHRCLISSSPSRQLRSPPALRLGHGQTLQVLCCEPVSDTLHGGEGIALVHQEISLYLRNRVHLAGNPSRELGGILIQLFGCAG
jgi:hypothetical protein